MNADPALRQDGYPSWPESAAPPWRDAEPPAADDASGWRGGRRPARRQPPPPPYRSPDGRSAQAQATLAAAELQAAKIRAEILKLSADLGGVATSFTEGLLSPAKPATKPTAGPPAKLRAQAAAGAAAPPAAKPAAPSATEPAAKIAAKPAARPAAKPATRSETVPATRPGVSPRRIKPATQTAGQTKNRQVCAARKVTAALVALTLAGVATGATELVLHGPAFFVFRANGAGASQTGPEEDQGPGQPNAPGAHHNAKVIPVKPKRK